MGSGERVGTEVAQQGIVCEQTLHGGKIGVCMGQCSMMEKAWALK